MPPVQAAALLVVPSLVTNVWQLVTGPRLTDLIKRFATMMLGVCRPQPIPDASRARD